ncbi:MAG: tetratricopeptide repeat protein [Cyanobacteria bacterium J06649_4]
MGWDEELEGDEVELAETFQRALKLIKVERVFEALPLLDEVIAARPEWAEAYVQRARVRKRLGDKERAIADYAKAINIAPTAEMYLARALIWLELSQVKGAIADSRQAAAMKPTLAGAHHVLGKALGIFGDGPGAIAAYKQAARCYLDAKDKQNAQKCLEAIPPLQALPPLPKSQQPAVPLGPTDRTATPEAFVRRVRLKYNAGDYSSSLEDLNWLLGVHPNFAPGLCLRGLIQARRGKRAEAVSDLAVAAQIAPDDPGVRLGRGQMRLILNDGYGAIEEFSALIEGATQDTDSAVLSQYFEERGHAYRLMNESEKAFKDYSNAIAINTENPLLYELRADVQQAMGSQESAIADYQQAATLWLNQGNWQKHQQVVESVRNLRSASGGLGLSSPSASAVSGSKSGVTVPIKSYHQHLPVVDVLFDGIAQFDVVIDRNAPNSIITRQMANQLNLNLVSYRYVYLADGTPMELSIAHLRSVKLGELVVTDVYVAIAPDNATVVLGKDCFSAYSIRISGNEITFARR